MNTPRTAPPQSGYWVGLWNNHWSIVLLTVFAIFPLFMNLGGNYLWSDEGDTAVLGKTILREGIPMAWDGKTFTDSDFGARVNKDLVMVSHPWLQYYVAAGSFLVFGETTFAARFPFALAGLLTIPLLYILVITLTSDRRIAISAAIFLVLSLQFLLFSRQCRNYSLNMLLVVGMLLFFFRLKNRRNAVWFAITAILAFHTNPSALAPLSALAALTLFHKSGAPYRKWFWLASPLIATFTVPWIFVARSGYQHNSSMLEGWTKLLPRFLQFFIEWASALPVIAIVILYTWIWVRNFRAQRNVAKPPQFNFVQGGKLSESIFSPGERTLVVTVLLIFLSYAALIALTQGASEIFSLGLRYATPLIPLTFALVAILIAKCVSSSRLGWVGLMLVLNLTNIGRLTPWGMIDQERVFFDESAFAAMHVPNSWQTGLLRDDLLSFVRELRQENPGTVAHVSKFLKNQAAPDDILITNYSWEPVYFHTGLRQGLKIIEGYPIYDAARKHKLPDYVFGIEGVRWIVWRWPWEGYRGYAWEPLQQALRENGAAITKVAEMPETTWENRPEAHFHRFPGNDYKYPWFPPDAEPAAEIFRVDWPGKSVAASN